MNKFAKSSSSRAGIPIVGFLVTNSVIKDPWRWPYGQVGKISSVRICRLGANMGHKNGHNSAPKASPRVRIWHAPSYHIPRGFSMPKGEQF